ncbi:putative protease [Chlamydia trachomatis]|nr:putative protease [Chlamydia trachomatis]
MLEWIQYNHDTIELTVKRDNQTINVNLKPIYDKENSVYLIGYKAIAYAQKTHWYEAFGNGTKNLWSSTTSIFTSLSHLIRGQGVENLSGPVGIFTVTKKTAEMGLSSYLSLFAIISLNIGIFNAIPIPALDGGRILIVLIEKIMRRKVNQRLVERIIMASFVFLMLIFVFATYNDIVRFL